MKQDNISKVVAPSALPLPSPVPDIEQPSHNINAVVIAQPVGEQRETKTHIPSCAEFLSGWISRNKEVLNLIIAIIVLVCAIVPLAAQIQQTQQATSILIQQITILQQTVNDVGSSAVLSNITQLRADSNALFSNEAQIRSDLEALLSNVTQLRADFSALNQTSAYTQQGTNLILNGDMQVSLTSTSYAVSSATTQYTLDRWQISTGSNQACTVSQQNGEVSGTYVAQIQRNAGQSGIDTMQFGTTLTSDMSADARNNRITLSFLAKKGADYSPSASLLTARVYSSTGGTDVSGINAGFAIESTLTVTLTNSMQRFVVTSTNVIGSSVMQLAVIFSFTPQATAGAQDFLQITDVQLEVGNIATPYDRRSLAWTMPQIYRFHYRPKTTGDNTHVWLGDGYAISSTLARIYFPMPVQMRQTPTITFDDTLSHYNVLNGQATSTCFTSSTWVVGSTPDGVQVQFTCSGGLTAGEGAAVGDYGTTPTFVDFSAELT